MLALQVKDAQIPKADIFGLKAPWCLADPSAMGQYFSLRGAEEWAGIPGL